MCIKMRFVNGARKKKSVLCAGFAALLLIGCGGGGKAVAGDYKLKVNVNPANGGSISISPNRESYNEWMDVEVTATANKGYIFTGWSGDATDKSRSVTIKMSGNKNKKLTANFKAVSVSAFTDSRDGKKYKTVTIGSQTWMGENLNHETVNSKCHDNNASNCTKYGRLYTWSAALTACPAGWHLPDTAEWNLLIYPVGVNDVGEALAAATKLKATSGWKNDGNGTDDYGFSALPGGCCGSNGAGAGSYGYWWTATEYNDTTAWDMSMNGFASGVHYPKRYLYSVRCVQN
jgi:uncharacterized protein (TIGR02145 family)/uncharacterized repeat protein (TIGR02543 family)